MRFDEGGMYGYLKSIRKCLVVVDEEEIIGEKPLSFPSPPPCPPSSPNASSSSTNQSSSLKKAKGIRNLKSNPKTQILDRNIKNDIHKQSTT